MQKPPIRVYADTSVYGGTRDDEFADDSRTFFEQVRLGRFELAVSAVVLEELDQAPASVRALFDEVLSLAQIAEITEAAQQLQRAYIDAGILTPKWEEDALHVALATTSGCRVIVSWNFKHIVHFQKIPRYNAVNVLHGYDPIAIHSPSEVIAYEEEDL